LLPAVARKIDSQIDTAGDEFRARAARWGEALAEVRALEDKVRQNSERARGKFEKRGQLMPRERLDLLLDRGAPFVQLSTLAGLNMHDDDGDENAAGAGSISGIGFVSGVRCAIAATDSGIKGGAVSPMGLQKSLRMQEIIVENKLPAVVLAESAGANLLYQSEMFIEGGRTFANQARISALGIPQITVVHGSSTAGGAYLPGLSDHVILVKDKSKIFLAGPPLLKAATGEIATDDELGGYKLHAEVSGTGEYVAADDAHAVEIARDVVAHLGWDPARRPSPRPPRAPAYDAEELMGVVPEDFKIPYDCREVIARIVDGSEFLEHKPDYGSLTVCGRAFLDGWPIGILANNGPIDPAGATKAAQFIQLCEQSRTPLLFLMNTTGYLVGTAAERGGIVKHGSKMIQAVANTTVPKVTIVAGGSWGAGNYGMAGRGLSPRFIFSWPSARVGVMGPEQAGKVMEIVAAAKFKRMGVEVPPDQLAGARDDIINKMEPETTALFGTARLWDDGIIDPRDTRQVVAFCLSTCREADARQLAPITFGAARL
jgi:geranyl-CoA carboxylase beta subunit